MRNLFAIVIVFLAVACNGLREVEEVDLTTEVETAAVESGIDPLDIDGDGRADYTEDGIVTLQELGEPGYELYFCLAGSRMVTTTYIYFRGCNVTGAEGEYEINVSGVYETDWGNGLWYCAEGNATDTGVIPVQGNWFNGDCTDPDDPDFETFACAANLEADVRDAYVTEDSNNGYFLSMYVDTYLWELAPGPTLNVCDIMADM